MKRLITRLRIVVVLVGIVVQALGWAPAVGADEGYAAVLAGQAVYGNTNPGEQYNAWITVRNAGTRTWRPGEVAFRGTDAWAGGWGLPFDVGPGKAITVRQTVAPQRAGVHRYGFVLTKSGQAFGPWFFVQVTVRSSAPAETNRGRRSVASNPVPDSSQCTYFAEERMHDATGLWMPALQNARDWADNARRYGWRVGNTPEINSVIVMQPGDFWFWKPGLSGWGRTSTDRQYGHVAWVAAVSCGGRCVYVRDRNFAGRGLDADRWFWIEGTPVNFIYST